MTKGTPSMGKKSKTGTHRTCRRCGQHSFHIAKKVCASCGFGKSKKLRDYNFLAKKPFNRKRKASK